MKMSMCANALRALVVSVGLLGLHNGASAVLLSFSDPNGLSATADFQLLTSTTLQIVLTNTSTGAPAGFDGAAQILTGLSWDFGALGAGVGDSLITGGTAAIGGTSFSVNFDTGAYGAGTDLGGEWGFGNGGGSGALQNAISSITAQVTAFGGPNLDGPVSLDGPQGGLVSSPPIASLGGQGAVQSSAIFTLTLSAPLADLGFLSAHGAQVEFGSDAFFIFVPAPATLPLMMFGFLGNRRRRG